MTLRQYHLSQQQDRLSDACNSKGYLEQGATGTFDVEARCAVVWVEIGAELGFDPVSRVRVEGKGVSEIMANPA